MWIVMIKSLRYYKIVMHKKVSRPDEIQNTKVRYACTLRFKVINKYK